MTHYTINYSNCIDEVAKHNKALADIKDFLGEERFNNLTEMFKVHWSEQPELGHFQLMCAFVGVQGYPVKAWYNYIWSL